MSGPASTGRPRWFTALLLAMSVVLMVVFVLLGNWQIRRLAWKQELIAAVDARAFREPVEIPAQFDPALHSYLRVTVESSFLDQPEVLVKAVTELGPGFWVMSPVQTQRGVLWVNRGFVPSATTKWAEPQTPLTGLLRPMEEGGTLLERNDPANARWVARDTVAMSQTFGLGATLPYFLDADHVGARNVWPRGGMTVIRFRNSHLIYALTWYAMAVLLAIALVYVLRLNQSSTS